MISRAPTKRGGRRDQWGQRHTSTFKVAGRQVLNLWRIIRTEHNFNIYTFENVAFHILRRRSVAGLQVRPTNKPRLARVPRFSFSTLTTWFQDSTPAHTISVMRHFRERVFMVLEILDEADVVTKNAWVMRSLFALSPLILTKKTSEFARVFGVDFFSVISRGSQFKVESFMFRIAKPESFVLLSPSKQDVPSFLPHSFFIH